MHGNFTDFTLLHFLFKDDLVARRDIGNFVQRLFMILAPGIGVVCVILIVECDAWADDIQYRNAVVRERGLEQFLYLLGVACK